jgi:hypothetical protein
MPILFRHAWIFLIVGTTVNALYFWGRSRSHVSQDPSLEDGYRKLFWGILVWGNIPWVIMGLGCLVGGVPSAFHYFRPRDGNAFVLAFFASVVIIWFLGTYWLFVRGGAEMIVRHPGLLSGPFGRDITSPAMVKVYWCLCLAGGIWATISMFVLNFPLPVMEP